MANNGQVHWHEGLFLQPHHLQAMQRQMLESSAGERRLGWPYPYGLIESRLSADALANMLVQFDRLRVVMPSGLVVEVPDAADLPPLDIKSAFQSTSAPFVVSIGVPVWYASRGNAVEDNGQTAARGEQVRRLYRVVDVERTDENTGENAQSVPLRRVNARLLLDGDDQSDLEVLPLLRIAHAAGQDAGLPRQDSTFLPPCLIHRGAQPLFTLLRDLANHVEARRGQLLARLIREKFAVDNLRGGQFAQLLKLRTLNYFAPRLLHLVKAPSVSPFDMYLELRGLVGELASLSPERDHSVVADYAHDTPSVPFLELDARIRALLPPEGEVTVLTASFAPKDRVLVADLTDAHIRRPNEYFLGIKTKQDAAMLRQLVEDADRFKLMARSLARANIWGIRLAAATDPPIQLPKPPGLHYFRLLLSETPSSVRMWERIGAEKSMSLKWADMESSDYEATLYMTVPEKES